jgi:hypothetical protein
MRRQPFTRGSGTPSAHSCDVAVERNFPSYANTVYGTAEWYIFRQLKLNIYYIVVRVIAVGT